MALLTFYQYSKVLVAHAYVYQRTISAVGKLVIQLDATHEVYSSSFMSTCFGHQYAHCHENNVVNCRIRFAALKREMKTVRFGVVVMCVEV
jgi:hypothetical protein